MKITGLTPVQIIGAIIVGEIMVSMWLGFVPPNPVAVTVVVGFILILWLFSVDEFLRFRDVI